MVSESEAIKVWRKMSRLRVGPDSASLVWQLPASGRLLGFRVEGNGRALVRSLVIDLSEHAVMPFPLAVLGGEGLPFCGTWIEEGASVTLALVVSTIEGPAEVEPIVLFASELAGVAPPGWGRKEERS